MVLLSAIAIQDLLSTPVKQLAEAELEVPVTPPSRKVSPKTSKTDKSSPISIPLFAGGSNSIVAKAVGSAEGTRTANGGKTWAYYGHVDPGNAAWNMGSFSYQHGASSPDHADRKQLMRLEKQWQVGLELAKRNGITPDLRFAISFLDLANQAPLAAMEQGGFFDRIQQKKRSNYEDIVQARKFSYFNPATNRWEAPGLGNHPDSIERDQRRRQDMIEATLKYHKLTGYETPKVR